MTPYINHITLSTGHARRSLRSEVGDDVLALLVPWLDRMLASNQKQPLPVAPLAHFSGSATVQAGALVCTLWAPNGPHTPGKPTRSDIPMVTLGIAHRSRHGSTLWLLMSDQFSIKQGVSKPQEPWCGVVVHPSVSAYRGDIGWMGDLERCIAWAWLTRHPAVRAVDG